jgi:malonate decarboxylase holo-[acyl-carrier-protein] synthase
MPADPYRRHDWVHLADDWRDRLKGSLRPDDEAALVRWLEGGRPLVVARREQGDASDLLRLRLALPGKKRIAVVLSAQAAARRRGPPLLLDVVKFGARFWPMAMRDLAALVARAASDTRVFGSFAWQSFAADDAWEYVTPGSDIDLLISADPGGGVSELITSFDDFGARHPAPRLDGGIALPGGEFVSCREYAARPKRILIKGAGGVSLRPIGDVDVMLVRRAA